MHTVLGGVAAEGVVGLGGAQDARGRGVDAAEFGERLQPAGPRHAVVEHREVHALGVDDLPASPPLRASSSSSRPRNGSSTASTASRSASSSSAINTRSGGSGPTRAATPAGSGPAATAASRGRSSAGERGDIGGFRLGNAIVSSRCNPRTAAPARPPPFAGKLRPAKNLRRSDFAGRPAGARRIAEPPGCERSTPLQTAARAGRGCGTGGRAAAGVPSGGGIAAAKNSVRRRSYSAVSNSRAWLCLARGTIQTSASATFATYSAGRGSRRSPGTR